MAFVYLLFTVQRAALQQWQHLMSSLNVIVVIQLKNKMRIVEMTFGYILLYDF